MSDGSLSLTKILRTPKVSPDAAAYAQYLRDVDARLCITALNFDQYGRPILGPVTGFPQLTSQSAPYCFSTDYLVELENAMRPKYSQFLDIPQGIGYGQNLFPNQPRMDTLGVNRDRAFGLDGTYNMPVYPVNATNPNDDAQWMAQMNWYTQSLNQRNDNRLGVYGNGASGY